MRTIYRDITALQEAGVPLWTEPGAAGGVRLVDGWEFPLDGLSSQETAALLVGSSGAADLGLGAVLTAAQSKVITALPPELRGRAARIQERVYLDAPGWFHRPEPVPHLSAVADAVWNERRIEMQYQSGERQVSRDLDPLGLVLKAGVWYFVAAHGGSPRTYRVSRILGVDVLAEQAERLDPFDLAAWWEASSREFDEAIRPLPATIRVDAVSLRSLAYVIPGPLTTAAMEAATPFDADGMCTLTIPVEQVDIAVSQLIQLSCVEVLDPPELRDALRQRCRALVTLNAGDGER